MLAALCLLVVAVLRGDMKEVRSLPWAMWRRLLLLGLVAIAVTQGAGFVSLAYLPAVTTNLIWSFSSVGVALLGMIWLAERPRPLQWAGILLALVGAMVYFYPAAIPSGQIVGVVVAVVGVIANAAASLMGREVNRSKQVSPLVVTLVSMGAGAPVMLAAGILIEDTPRISVNGWLIIAWLAVVNTAFAFTLWNRTLRQLTAMESSIVNGTMLIWIPMLAVMFLGERIAPREVFGLAMAAVGTLIVQVRRNRSAQAKPGVEWRTAEERLGENIPKQVK
jgi:drug/metabolite transporter (DMT)-like permease